MTTAISQENIDTGLIVDVSIDTQSLAATSFVDEGEGNFSNLINNLNAKTDEIQSNIISQTALITNISSINQKVLNNDNKAENLISSLNSEIKNKKDETLISNMEIEINLSNIDTREKQQNLTPLNLDLDLSTNLNQGSIVLNDKADKNNSSLVAPSSDFSEKENTIDPLSYEKGKNDKKETKIFDDNSLYQILSLATGELTANYGVKDNLLPDNQSENSKLNLENGEFDEIKLEIDKPIDKTILKSTNLSNELNFSKNEQEELNNDNILKNSEIQINNKTINRNSDFEKILDEKDIKQNEIQTPEKNIIENSKRINSNIEQTELLKEKKEFKENSNVSDINSSSKSLSNYDFSNNKIEQEIENDKRINLENKIPLKEGIGKNLDKEINENSKTILIENSESENNKNIIEIPKQDNSVEGENVEIFKKEQVKVEENNEKLPNLDKIKLNKDEFRKNEISKEDTEQIEEINLENANLSSKENVSKIKTTEPLNSSKVLSKNDIQQDNNDFKENDKQNSSNESLKSKEIETDKNSKKNEDIKIDDNLEKQSETKETSILQNKDIKNESQMENLSFDILNQSSNLEQSGALSVSDEVIKISLSQSIKNSEIQINGLNFDNVQNQKINITENVLEKNNVLNQVSDRISDQFNLDFEKLNIGDTKKLTLVLRPSELGRVQLDLALDKNGLSTNILAQSDEVKQYIEKNIDVLKQNLASSGINVNSIKIKVAGSNSTSTYSSNQEFSQNSSQNLDNNNSNNENNQNQHQNQNFKQQNKRQSQEILANLTNYDMQFAKDFSGILSKTINYSLS